MTRLFDIIFSCIALIIITPLLLPVIIALKLTGEHDIFYTQDRVGKNKKVFKVLKFATMLRNSETMTGGLITLDKDPRILPLGHFLRKTKINELPQIINVLLGQMSVVGYRPFAVKHYSLYKERVQSIISTVVPGLSGIGSIVFRNEEQILHSVENPEYVHDTIITPYKGELECWYVEHRSLWNYFCIIFCTVWVIVKPKSTIWKKLFRDLPPVPENLEKYI